MGQTLTHGIYLPDEGERNCYAGLAANWQILDNSVGTIASHTTQIAGKANAVHTHGKADITDLFNSANEWTQINTYTVALRFSAANYSAGTPSSDIFYGSLQWGGIVNNTFVQSFGINNAIRSTGINDISLRVWSQTGSILRGVAVETNADASNSSFRPLVNNVTNLGSTVYQWNNIYSKGYYYNGIAWGLDKENTWSANQKITNNPSYLYFKNTSMTMGTAPASNKYSGVIFQDSNNTELGNVTYKKHKNSNNVLVLNVKNTDGTNNYECSASLSLTPSGSASFYPEGADCNLGQSTTPWKTLNGINPGALSLPNLSRKSSILEYITDLTGGLQYYTPVDNGWICIQADNASVSNYIRCAYDDILVKADGNGQAQGLSVLIPVLAGVQVGIRVVCTTLSSAYFYHCQGNAS